MVAAVKACNFTNIKLHHRCIFVNFLKFFERYFDSHKNTGEKIFAKYLSTNNCFVITNTINNAMFPNTRAFAFTRQSMKQNFA